MYYYPDTPYACTKASTEILDREGDPDQEFSPIVLVDRGNCSFIRKARNVQDIGGALCLIADNRADADPNDILMVDDGTGLNVAIPTVMISKEIGMALKAEIRRTEEENKRAIQKGQRKQYVVLIVEFEPVARTATA